MVLCGEFCRGCDGKPCFKVGEGESVVWVQGMQDPWVLVGVWVLFLECTETGVSEYPRVAFYNMTGRSTVILSGF